MTAISECHDFTNEAAPSACSRTARAWTSTPALANCARYLLAVAPVGRQQPGQLAVIREGVQRRLGDCVDGEWCGQRLDVEDIRRFWILRARAGPQESLGPPAGVVNALPAWRTEERAVRLIGALRHRDPELIPQRLGGGGGDGGVPATDKDRSDRCDLRLQAGVDPALDASEECFSSGEVVLAREQQGHVDRDPGEDRLLDGGQSFGGTGDLDHQVRTSALAKRLRAAAMVPAVSFASSGDTSSDTQPSMPLVRS